MCIMHAMQVVTRNAHSVQAKVSIEVHREGTAGVTGKSRQVPGVVAQSPEVTSMRRRLQCTLWEL